MSRFLQFTGAICALATAVFFAAIPVKASDVIEEFEVGAWGGWAYNEDGAFSYCIIARESPGRRALILLRGTDIGYAFAIYDESAPYSENRTYKTRTSIDRRWSYEVDAVVATRELLRLPITKSLQETAFGHVAEGSRLQISVNGQRMINVSLSGSRRAIDRLDQCYDTYAPRQAPDLFVSASHQLKSLAEVTGITPPSGSLNSLRAEAEGMDAAALIRLGLALVDYPHMMQYDDEGASLIAMTADAGDIRGLFILGRLMQLRLTSESYDGHAEELIYEAADAGLAEALYLRAQDQRDYAPEEAYVDALRAADQGHVRANDLVALLDSESSSGTTAAIPQPPKPKAPASAVPAPKPPAPVPGAPAQVAQTPDIQPASPRFTPDQAISVQYQGLPASGANWIAISAPDHAPDAYFDNAMLPQGATEGTHDFKALPPGTYELRVYLDWPDGGYDVVAQSTVTVATVAPQPPAPATPLAPQSEPERSATESYELMGSLACFGEADYPEAWRSQFDCKAGGCFVGIAEIESCLETAHELEAGMVLHGNPEGLWPNECWIQSSCTDLRDHPDFNTYKRLAMSAPASPMSGAVATPAPPPPSPMQAAKPAKTPVPPPVPADDVDGDLVFAIQALMQTAGRDAGPVDGVISEQLTMAIMALQMENGLPQDGVPTEAVRDLLMAGLERQDAAPASAPTPTPAPATEPEATPTPEPKPTTQASGDYISPMCRDYNDNYTVPMAEIRSHSCYFTPPQTVHVGPKNLTLVTCGYAEIHYDKTTRTLSKCRADFGDMFTMDIPDGSVTCYEADFYEDGTLKSCGHEYQHAMAKVQTMGLNFTCSKANFDEQGRLTQCSGAESEGGEVTIETGYGVPITCTTQDYHAVTFENGQLSSCWSVVAFEPETEKLVMSCPADKNWRFDEAGLIVEVDQRNCARKLKSAIGEPTATLRRPHPEPGPTDLKAMPICDRTSAQCSLKEPRWIALGPDGAEQIYCGGHLKMHANPGYLKTCDPKGLVTFEMHGAEITCNEFEVGPDGLVTACEGNEDSPSFAMTQSGGEILCSLNHYTKDVGFWPGGNLQFCTLEEPAILTLDDQGHSAACAPDQQIRFWPNGNLEKCETVQPATVFGPYGGEAKCQTGELRLLPDGTLHHCAFAEGASLPVELPGGQQLTCFSELEMHIEKDKETKDLSTSVFGGCDLFDKSVDLTSAGETHSCLGAAFYPPRKGGGLYACITKDTDRYEVNHDYQPDCPVDSVIAITFDREGALNTVHSCKKGG